MYFTICLYILVLVLWWIQSASGGSKSADQTANFSPFPPPPRFLRSAINPINLSDQSNSKIVRID